MPRKVNVDTDPWSTGGTEHPIGRIAGKPAPGKWNAWVVEQGSVWVDSNNNVYLIKDISHRYAFNVLRFLFMQHREDLGDPYSNPLVKALVARLRRGWDTDELTVLVRYPGTLSMLGPWAGK
jgi:hypothetical protein